MLKCCSLGFWGDLLLCIWKVLLDFKLKYLKVSFICLLVGIEIS